LLLQTKLFKPTLRPSLIPRPQLIAQLNAVLGLGTPGLAARFTLVSAPAGFGKTTLVSAWLAQLTTVNPQFSEQNSAWLSLDENDNDPVRFLDYFIAAIQTVVPGIGETAVHALQSPRPPAAEVILTLLINDIIRHERPIILVLDDYHVITAPSIHQALTFLLEHQPQQLHLLITTRSDPPLPLSRLRARGQMVEIREKDLRFTFDEVRLFFDQVMGLTLSTGELKALEQRIEGWVAGLQLAALSMHGRDDLSDFIAAFTGSNHFIMDYLIDEVLERRPKGTKNFLLQTSILDHLCGPLCDAVTGRSDSQAILERLVQANLFLLPLDQERQWYRYHHLFADVLLNRLGHEAASPAAGMELLETLHRRASDWFDAHGLLDEAIQHALAAPDIERAAALVEQSILPMIHRNEIQLLRSWLEQLPLDVVMGRPRLLLGHGWVLMFTGKSQAAKKWLAVPQVEAALNSAGLPPEIQGELALLRASIARARFEGDHGLADAQQALALLPVEQPGLRAGAIHLIGVAQFRQGDTAAASQAFIEAVAVGEAEEGPYMALDALQDLASIQIRQGHLEQIKQTCQQAMRMADRWGGRLLPVAGMAYIDFGGVLYEQNDLVGAAQALEHGINLLRGSTEHYLLSEGYTLLARVNQAVGDQAGALTAIEEGEDWLNQIQIADERSWAFLALGQARVWLSQGDIDAAARWARGCNWWPDDTHLGHHQAVTLVRLRLAQSRYNGQKDALLETAGKVKQLLAATESKAWWGHVIELSVLRALLCRLLGDGRGAMTCLERALRLGRPEGYLRIFVDEGQPLRALLFDFRSQQPRHRTNGFDSRSRQLLAYIDKLLAASPAPVTPSHPGSDSLLDPLSQRELEVLHLVATGASNQDIADALVVALPTAKKHVSNILSKLNASSRTQAVAEARDLGLL